jgi:hypothetical protein
MNPRGSAADQSLEEGPAGAFPSRREPEAATSSTGALPSWRATLGAEGGGLA